jgi:N-methylhydantoinase A/oxoprolinase/acetone carboxylase beta subunit
MFEIIIGTGGTVTNGVLIDDKQRISVATSETEPVDPSKSTMSCIARLAKESILGTRCSN